ncbi:LamG-like jellyroll fold domain-containing protein [Flavicella sp.]|uniref:LamG-like jellyroll fold domain-containing protein n=1 Tax=Flavicella sp. TaxID=2957742 RepID=UPI00301780CA
METNKLQNHKKTPSLRGRNTKRPISEKRYFFLIFLLFSNFIYSQNDLSVDDVAFICEHTNLSIEKNLLLGTRAFILDINETKTSYTLNNSKEQKQLEQAFIPIQKFLKNNSKEIIPLIFKGTYDENQLRLFLKNYFVEKIYFQNEVDWPKIASLKEKGIQILAIFKSDIVSTSIERIRKENKYNNRFSSDPLHKLVLFKSNAITDSILLKNCFELWRTTGKAPNFIVAPKIKISNLKIITDSLNQTRRFRGVLEYNGKRLNKISWIKSPKISTPAKFSFPLTKLRLVLSPYKNGYRITPAEVIHHVSLSDAPRIFTAFDVILKDKLIYDFSFDNEIVNSMEPEWSRAISKDISFVKDSKRGNVLYLNTLDSFIDYSKENTLNFETPISISVWVKPDSIPQFMGILGFGMAFSFKLKKGNPDFTTATIKDHVIKHPLKIHKWHHLVAIYNPKTTIEFYLDGKMIGESNITDIIPSNQSLVIGNNIWGEQFYGSIDDLKIWDRGLSSKEIATLYNYKPIKNTNMFSVFIGVLGLIGLVVLVIYIRRRLIKRSISTPKKASKPQVIPTHTQNTLRLFGDFEMYLASKETTLSFSPLHKQLLSFLVLTTLEDKEGVNTNKLTETFWPGAPKLKAKENRNGNIRKLRMVLSGIDGLEVVFENKKWRILNNRKLKIDIFFYTKLKENLEANLMNDKFSLDELEAFLELVKKGNILQNTQTEWTDYYKNKISNEVENLLSKIHKAQNKNLPPQLNIKIAKTILLFDNLNENALGILITELVSSGKHGLAQNVYTTFAKNYEALYVESFDVKYQSFIKK